MDGQNYLVFHTAADDSYMNSSANFRGADVTGNTTLEITFAAANDNAFVDTVVLNFTAGKEVQVMEALGAALAGAKNPVTVVADDINSKYIDDNITSCGAITTAKGSYRRSESLTANKDLAPADSGKTFFLNAAAGLSAIKLPAAATAGAGWNARFVVATVTTSNNYVITEDTASDTDVIISQMSILEIDTNDDGLDSAGHTTITFESTPALGDHVEIECDGTKFYAKGLGKSDDFVTLA
jgi:hypothetical protein|tara:strand:+ start:34 stop:753 length:720 start_codon:yes stop_codon:yes gene_type:complete